MPNLGELRDSIASELTRTDINDDIEVGIRAAIQALQYEKLAYNETLSPLTTTASQDYVVLPADFFALVSLRLVTGTYTRSLQPLSYDDIEAMDTQSSYEGEPYYYALFNERIRLFPIPNDNYDLQLRYHQTFTLPTATTDTHALIDKDEFLVRAKAKAWLYLNRLKQPNMAAPHEMEASERMARLKREYLGQQTWTLSYN